MRDRREKSMLFVLVPKCTTVRHFSSQAQKPSLSVWYCWWVLLFIFLSLFTPCKYKLPLFVCTACTQHSSTSAPGIGMAASTHGSVCYGHAHSRWRRSSCPCGTSVLLSLPSTCWPGRSWASPQCAAGQRCVRKARLGCELVCGAAHPHLLPGWWHWLPWERSHSAPSAPCRFCGMVLVDANMSALCTSLTRRGTYRWYPHQP